MSPPACRAGPTGSGGSCRTWSSLSRARHMSWPGVMTRWDAIPLVAGLHLWHRYGSLTSVLLPYPVPGPGQPVLHPPGSVGSSFIAQMVFMASDIAVCAPGLALGLWWLTGGPAWARWASLAVSVVLGLAVLAFGIWRGGAYLDGNADRVLARVNRAQ